MIVYYTLTIIATLLRISLEHSNTPMNSMQLDTILSLHMCTASSYVGTFASDQLPRRIRSTLPALYIANTDIQALPGSHWVCIWFSVDKSAYYFDSYGLHPSFWNKWLINFLNDNSKRWLYNYRQLQSLHSDICGKWCLYAADIFANRNKTSSVPDIVIGDKYPKTEKERTRYDSVIETWTNAHFNLNSTSSLNVYKTEQRCCSLQQNLLINYHHGL